MNDVIKVDKHAAVTLITINRTEAMNALDFSANDALVDAFKAFNDDRSANVAVVTGEGAEAFCAGADLKSYTMAFATHSSPEFRRRFTNGYGLGGITRGLHIDKPIVAAVNGYAISGGLEIALACDIRWCSENAQFGLQDVKWGFHACDGALVRLREIVGLGNAMEIVLSGDLIDAAQAFRIGLVNRILPQSELLAEALAYARRLASRAPLAQQFAKEVIRRSQGLSLDEALKLESASFHDLAFSDDLKEGTAAFEEKREARFKGK